MEIFKKIINNKFILILIGGVLFSIASVSAAIIVSSNEVTITSDSTTKTNLHDAIEELYGLVVSADTCPYGQTCIRCDAGTYADQTNMTCSSCVAGTYSTGGVNSCITCPDGYTSDASATSINECYLNTTAGKFIEIANSSVQMDCPAGSYCPSAKINYGSVGQAIECLSGYTSDSGSTKESDCYIETTAGKYIASAGDSTQTNCPAGSYCSGSVKVNYGNTGGISGCPSGYTSGANATAASSCYLTTSAGYYVATANQGETACTAGGYCPGGTTVYYGSTGGRTGCPSGYGNSSASSTSASNCYLSTSSGKFVATANQGETACTSGGYCPGGTTVYYGSTGGRTGCPSGYGNSAASSTASSSCYLTTSAGYYVATAGGGQSNCPGGYYCPGGSAIYYGNTGGVAGCPSGYTSGANATAASSCYLTTSAGYYVANAGWGQSDCPGGYYCPGGSTIYYGNTGGIAGCPSGYGSSGANSSAASQCYMTTTAGNYVATSGGSQTQCTAGNYCPSATIYYGSTGNIQSCGSGKTSPAGSSSASACVSSTYTLTRTTTAAPWSDTEASGTYTATYTCDRTTGIATLTKCDYSGPRGNATCNGGSAGADPLTMCISKFSYNIEQYCNTSLSSGVQVYGGRMNSTINCS